MKLDIKQMVIPLKYAVYLKERGIRQQSLYYWVLEECGKYELTIHKNIRELVIGQEVPDIPVPKNYYAAFLTDELSFILDDKSPFNLYKTNLRFEYNDTHLTCNFWEVFSFGAEIVRAFAIDERDSKDIRKKRATRAPQSPKKPNTNGDFN